MFTLSTYRNTLCRRMEVWRYNFIFYCFCCRFVLHVRNNHVVKLRERVEIILLCGREGWTQREIAVEFNNNHLERNTISQSAVAKLLKGFCSILFIHLSVHIKVASSGNNTPFRKSVLSSILSKNHMHISARLSGSSSERWWRSWSLRGCIFCVWRTLWTVFWSIQFSNHVPNWLFRTCAGRPEWRLSATEPVYFNFKKLCYLILRY
jgi:hypothetical protein